MRLGRRGFAVSVVTPAALALAVDGEKELSNAKASAYQQEAEKLRIWHRPVARALRRCRFPWQAIHEALNLHIVGEHNARGLIEGKARL